jgi:hypothetical protein
MKHATAIKRQQKAPQAQPGFIRWSRERFAAAQYLVGKADFESGGSMQTLTKAAVVGVGLVAGFAATAHAQYYNSYGAYYGTPNTYSWSPYNYPGYQTSVAPNPYYYYYPGDGYAYNYPTYNYYAGTPYPSPKAFWDPYVGLRPYSDNAGPKASGHGSP